MGILPAIHRTPTKPYAERGQTHRDKHDRDHADESSDESHSATVARRFQGDCGVPTPHQRARLDSVAGYFLGLDSDERPKLNALMKNNPTWPKAFAFIGLTIMGLALAYYSTSIATAGVAGRILGTDTSGDVLSIGAAFVMVGVAMAAVFGFLALTQIRALGRRA
jgi:hypothetical protein